ncbi:hypothetical protein Dsin_016810 [Dipteronia sinensis]|uniref:Peptidase S54 rhomboid domain-containing protein n=1 Tax=Dipteronia sinensis TaxID=43782 RepID=A0AAE0E5Z3_9ROSI|nr:hypothetical protein Dsin_016810 [Dipteronia sinensis]
MAVVPLCCKIPSKEQVVVPKQNSVRNSEQEFICGRITVTNRRRHDTCSRGSVLWNVTNSSYVKSFSKQNICRVCYASESSTSKGQLRLLHSYFAKQHQHDANQISSKFSNKTTEILRTNANKGLDSLDAYLGKLNKDANLGNYVSSASDDQNTESNLVVTPYSVRKTLKDYRKLRQKESGNEELQQDNETPDLYLISTLASINIAVFLFEIASPIRNSEFELFSLPLLYGAKINDLILIGEWWRLVTPMFLHAGVVHVALSCWGLVTFGPQVCKGYGSFTFLLIYTLGGISGNLTSFLHTPQPTVGGTGPVFAVIGTWLIYQIQNKDVIVKDPSESSMFHKAIIATALGFIMTNFGPVIDNWTHLGAAFTGMLYGFLTCPIVQVDETSSRSQEERITLVRQSADPCKSLFIFTIFILVLSSSLLFFFEPL